MSTCNILESLKPVSLEDQALFQKYLSAYPPTVSELTFTNIFCWAEIRHHLFCEHEGHLLIAFRDAHCLLNFYPPVGPNPQKIMKEFFSGPRKYYWSRIDEHLAHSVPLERKRLLYDRKNSDYVYALDELRALKGKKYDGKRNFIKRCAKLNPLVRPLRASDKDACMLIQERWLEERGRNESSREESTALIKALSHFDTFSLKGIAVVLEGKVVGFAIGEPLNRTTFVEHFEKGLQHIPGIYPYVLHAFASSIPSEFSFLNREQDLGIEGIRTSKESWHPAYLVRKFVIAA